MEEKFVFSALKQYDFIVLLQEGNTYDGGLIMDIDRHQKIIRFLSPKQEDVVDLILDEEIGKWRFLRPDKGVPRVSFSLRRESYVPSFFG